MMTTNKNSVDRRQFLKQAGLGVAAGSLSLAGSTSTVLGANDRFVIGVIGCGGMGMAHCKGLATMPDVKVAYVCDVDSNRANQAKQVTKADQAVVDMRRVLDDKGVDAVFIATGDYWHAPAAILACEAGKHVYVEKPCSHNLREGQLMIEAARRTKRLVQHGTQSRSNEFIAAGIRKLREGVIGTVLVAKAWNVQLRSSIGRGKPGTPPSNVDYDLWLGPAPFVPFQANRFHGVWRWWYDFGTGDLGNDGVHELDIARWGLGVDTLPSSVSATGGKYFFDDDQQFPDTAMVSFEYAGDGKVGSKRMLFFEQRIWSTNSPWDIDNGVEFWGTKGRMMLTKRGKVEILGERNKPIEVKLPAASDRSTHARNFFEAIRAGRPLNADIETGFLSAALSHLGNIAIRLGRSPRFDPQKAQYVDDAEANQLLRRTYREGHWAVPKGA